MTITKKREKDTIANLRQRQLLWCKTRGQARNSIFEYVAIFYNRQRPHSELGYLTPLEYKEMYYSQLAS